MKHFKIPAIALAVVMFAYCKTSKKTESTPTPAPVAAKPAYTPSAKQMEFAQARWANTTDEEVKEGQNIYVTKCAKCHVAFDIMEFSEKKWIHEIDKMSPKAELTADEKLKLSKHILSYHAANSVKPN